MREVQIAFLGLGNVGSGVYKILQMRKKEFEEKEDLRINIKRILVRNINKKRAVEVDRNILTDNPDDILNDPEISIVAEFIGGEKPALEYLLKALNSGKTVVTANKEVIARHWEKLDEAAKASGAGLYYEASVCGGIPVIKAIQESLQANRIERIMGIINGTTNYILTKMSENNERFEEALRKAQELGYAEPDPTADIEGYDAAFKLSILSTLCFHKRVHLDNILREGITNITLEDISYGRELGYALKLLAIAKDNDGKVEARVHPTFIPLNHPLSSVRSSFNAVYLKGDCFGDMMFFGRGAGDLPTGSAVVSDILTACGRKEHRYMDFGKKTADAVYNDDWKTKYYVRLTVKDQPGVLAEIAGYFGKYQVSIASVIQKGYGDTTAPLIFVTHEASEKSIQKAIAEIRESKYVISVDNLIRVEE
ncbi:homoserine dehydrogenase Hom [Thermoclostridium stercorarium subsp. stercorarium DSM 8532]|uniref:Homoserine dehydrogenase n=1 Tax=Thermoclostridium stercorarium (strain ATCC 35414 / DSM 8532 / NCIMB 11754) TaxID=1121335 RepID=L7VKY5_THES1|nr:homoserine dehydrogenase [Thermoclostridium stercorarium]AGC67329.1 homoserine dehydrogenase Hom [Thermoclostridium stercorarium subsp. stercorarium DSM 8532]AGI38391.1 homoserine dehydrogenase [Thermoclostridium stercorarium subsp. stercorarium DSM 8532]